MDGRLSKDIFGRFVVAALAAFFLFKYSYEVNLFVHGASDFLLGVANSITVFIERSMDNAGILVALFLVIVAILWAIILIILVLVGGLLAWLVVTLNDIYVLPFLLPLITVYSRFSYAFIVRPILWLPKKVLSALVAMGRLLVQTFKLFIVLPLGEVMYLRKAPAQRTYRISLSLLFVLGFCGLLVGGAGVATKAVQGSNLIPAMNSFISEKVAGFFELPSYRNLQRQAAVEAVTPNWTATAIQLQKGDVVSFTATGSVKCIAPLNKGFYTGSPAGMRDAASVSGFVAPTRLPDFYRLRGFTPNNYVLPEEPINCLMGKVGTGEAFSIGRKKTYKVSQDGELFLGINQLWRDGAWKNNQGQLSVNLIIRRKA